MKAKIDFYYLFLSKAPQNDEICTSRMDDSTESFNDEILDLPLDDSTVLVADETDEAGSPQSDHQMTTPPDSIDDTNTSQNTGPVKNPEGINKYFIIIVFLV